MISQARPKARGSSIFSALLSMLITTTLCNGCTATATYTSVSEWDRWRNQKNNPNIMSAPLTRLNGRPLKIFHADWFTINGDKNRDMPTTAPWPDPTRSKAPYTLEFFTPVAPSWVEVRFFREDHKNLEGVTEEGRWVCDIEAKKCPVNMTGDTVSVILPESLFAESRQKFTFQALWDIPPSQRHPKYPDLGVAVATWLYNKKRG